VDNFLSTKRQELHYMGELSDEERIALYLDTV
jgi:glutamine synthetase